MRFLYGLLICVCIISCNSNNKDFSNSDQENIVNIGYIDTTKREETTIKSTNIIKDSIDIFNSDIDLSSAFLESYFGAFGNNYQKIDLKIQNIKRNEDNHNEYIILGSTIKKEKDVKFDGIIEINSIDITKNNPYGFEDGTNFSTKVLANYKFIDDKDVSGSGVFTGDLTFTIVLQKDGSIHNDLWEWWGDGYSNYDFNGEWIDNNGDSYKCVFGHGRLLHCGDLDQGDGMFYPNKKYHKYGWEDYIK